MSQWKPYSYYKDYYRRKWTALQEALGGQCAACGSTERLEFDHIRPSSRTWKVRDAGFFRSAQLYAKDAEHGLLQLLCRDCHQDKRRIERYDFRPADIRITKSMLSRLTRLQVEPF